MTQPTVTFPIDLERVHILSPDDKPWQVAGGWPGPVIVYIVVPQSNDPDEVHTFVAGYNDVLITAAKNE